MPDLDDELIARALQWCAAAGRSSSAERVRAALAPLSWDQLLAARALLADPPPARPLGPQALADLARGALPEVAAERERAGQYRHEADGDRGAPSGEATVRADAPAEPAVAAAAPPRARRRGAAAPAASGPVIRRARDRVFAPPAVPPPAPAIEDLLESEGRAVLGRLLREHGARRARLVGALATGWRRRDGTAITDADLDQLLDAHGLTRSFRRRERDELLHALRAAGGVVARAAERVGVGAEPFASALARLGATAEAEDIRAVHRDELRRRGTLSERVRLVLEDPERLADLGVLAEIEDDLRRRLPEHLRALRAAAASPIAAALARSLSVPPGELAALLRRLGLPGAGDEAAGATPGGPVRRAPQGAFRPASRAPSSSRAGAGGPSSRGASGPRRPAGASGEREGARRSQARPATGPRGAPATKPRPGGRPPTSPRKPHGGPAPRGRDPGRPPRSGARPARGPGRRGPR